MTAALVIAAGAVLLVLWVARGVLLRRAAAQVVPLAEALATGSRAQDGPVAGDDHARAAAPSLTVVMAARDEAEAVEASVRSFRAQRLPGLEIVVVDDRSTDGTAGILDRIAAAPAPAGAPPLDIVHVRHLPDGWLGKCHACHAGAARARGAWILFTDGDVELAAPDLLERVLAHAERLRLDHVALLPDTRPMGPLQQALMGVFGEAFLGAARAHEMERDRPRGGAGVGAFNLVRRRAYDAVGGHTRLRMDLADDFKLGRLLKESGARQRIYDGLGLVRCAWHRGALNVVRGLEKNLFAGLDFSLPRLVLVSVAALFLVAGPAAVAVAGAALSLPRLPPAAALAWAPLLAQATVVGAAAIEMTRRSGGSALRLAALYPAAVALLLAAAWNSAARTLLRGGVRWRDTFYPLADLRRGLVAPGTGRRPA